MSRLQGRSPTEARDIVDADEPGYRGGLSSVSRVMDRLQLPRTWPRKASPACSVAASPHATLVAAARDLADPVGGIAAHTSNGGGSQSTYQQPQKLPAAALDGVMGLAIALMQLVLGQIRMEAGAFWHAPVLQQLPAPPYHARTGGGRSSARSLPTLPSSTRSSSAWDAHA